jgi:two-component system response regulator FixJ
METKNQTVFIIDDEIDICHSLKWLFESVHLRVETYESANLFLEKFDNKKQGCIIMDVRLPGMSGLELLEQLKLQKTRIPVLIITGYGDIPMAVRAMKAGAVDFIMKPFNDQYLLESVQKYIQRTVNTAPPEKVHHLINSLTEREHKISSLILDGKLNKEIAYELSISISTVEAHRANIMQKVKAKNLAQFIKMYLQAQINNDTP